MKIFAASAIAILSLTIVNLDAQYPPSPVPQYPEEWNSMWITHPGIDEAAYGLIHFRNAFDMDVIPEEFIIHVSGDNRYRFYVNGTEVGYGPQLSDTRHWRYESYDIAPFLQKGKNIMAAEVMNWGIERSYGIISFKTAFLVQGHTEKEAFLNTDWESNWKVLKNEGMIEKPVYWRTSGEIVGGFYAANPTDFVVASEYPWGWKSADYEDGVWAEPEVVFSRPKTDAGAGHGWILQPRTTSIQASEKQPLGPVIRSDMRKTGKDFRFGEKPLQIPAQSTHTFLLDQGEVTLGYPKLKLSGGKDARVKIIYSEALYDEHLHKGNRNVTKGKEIRGISDVYMMDGGTERVFQPMWFRTFRFIQVEVTTKDEPLVIEDYYNVYSASPIPVIANFKTGEDVYDEVWKICEHGIEICAQDNLLSDAYYEQMQYVGDLRPHLKAWTALTGDLTYFRSAMEQFNNSRLPDGNITSCYPLKATFVHPTYSLMWIDMLHDLMMLDGDRELIGSYTGEIQEVFDYYESIINEQGLVGKSNYHMFIDWYLPKGGNSKVNRDGNSAILTLNYAYTLQNAAELMEWLGYRERAERYAIQAKKYAEITRKLCFDPEQGIYADDPEHTFYDQRATILAVLTGAHSDDEKLELMKRILDSQAQYDSYANLFYYFYLFEAMEETGYGNFTEQLQPWKEIVEMGMTATPEKRIEQDPRSEVHPWTAHPVHYYFSVVAGIRPTSPGFRTVEIAPNPGDLENVKARYPTKHGMIEVELEFDGKYTYGEIVLPGDMTGVLKWQGHRYELHPGENDLY